MSQPATFGSVICTQRKKQKLTQKDLASQILREDGVPISAQYLNDIEHDRRSPSSDFIVKQLAKILNMPEEYLYYMAGKFPTDDLVPNATPQMVEEAMFAFRESIQRAQQR
ncbi:XRE family transcriptional regulator [Herbaspirillum huttiense]|uniref:helix-turn-helix domain-containing protein n=1 Tax=Herbaspirillum huttiense TaxID=863372 RepID=UPI0010656D8D|nr:helix-turn-helix transcriptional regulator [Herbaspirillum huttiense]QBP73577.1 XRE family transcriptional regulator [Herbaspirillum huttiense]